MQFALFLINFLTKFMAISFINIYHLELVLPLLSVQLLNGKDQLMVYYKRLGIWAHFLKELDIFLT